MPVVDQLERHPWLQETPMTKYNQEHQIVTQAWAPLGRGQLMEEPVLKQIADHHDRSVAQVPRHGKCLSLTNWNATPGYKKRR